MAPTLYHISVPDVELKNTVSALRSFYSSIEKKITNNYKMVCTMGK